MTDTKNLDILAWVACQMGEVDMPPSVPLKTEDTGKILEKAVCLAFDIPYNGPFKYSETDAQQLAVRLHSLPEHFPLTYTHTAKGGAPYDFTTVDAPASYISCKSNKSGQKVAPHSIGQAQPEEFCQRVGQPYTDIPTLKVDLQKPEITTKLLSQLENNTFDAPIIYYHKKDNTIQLIRQVTPITWDGLDYSWTRTAANWNNSSTLKANRTSVLEVQFHQKSRTNMAVRWNFKNVLKLFPKCFAIVHL